MPSFDMEDPRQVAIAASAGGSGLASLAMGRKRAGVDIGNLLIRYEGDPEGKHALLAGKMDEEKTPIVMDSMDFGKLDQDRWGLRDRTSNFI